MIKPSDYRGFFLHETLIIAENSRFIPKREAVFLIITAAINAASKLLNRRLE